MKLLSDMCVQVPDKSKGNTYKTRLPHLGLSLVVMSAFLYSISSLLVKVSSFLCFEWPIPQFFYFIFCLKALV